jgi:CRISPR-associated protein Csx10
VIADLTNPVKVDAGPDKASQDDSGQALSPAMVDYARLIEKEAWRAEIRRASADLAATPKGRARVFGEGCQDVPRTQLASLHDVLRHLDNPEESVGYWLKRLEGKHDDTRLRAPDAGWPRPVREKVENLLDRKKGTVWELLGLSGRGQPESGGPAGARVQDRARARVEAGNGNGNDSGGKSARLLTAAEQLTIDSAKTAELREQLWPEAVRTVVTDCLTALRRSQGDIQQNDRGQSDRGRQR